MNDLSTQTCLARCRSPKCRWKREGRAKEVDAEAERHNHQSVFIIWQPPWATKQEMWDEVFAGGEP